MFSSAVSMNIIESPAHISIAWHQPSNYRSVVFLGISVGGCLGRATARNIFVPPTHRKPHPRFTAHDRGHTLITKNNPRTEKISTLYHCLTDSSIIIAISISTIQVCHSICVYIYIEEIVQLVNHSVIVMLSSFSSDHWKTSLLSS